MHANLGSGKGAATGTRACAFVFYWSTVVVFRIRFSCAVVERSCACVSYRQQSANIILIVSYENTFFGIFI